MPTMVSSVHPEAIAFGAGLCYTADVFFSTRDLQDASATYQLRLSLLAQIL